MVGAQLGQHGVDVAAVGRFAPDRRPDLWSGVGLAATFAGGASADDLARLRRLCGPDGAAYSAAELRVSRITTVVLGIVAVLLGIAFEKQNIAFMVSLAFAIAASANFPVLLMSVLWKDCTTRGVVIGGFLGLMEKTVAVGFDRVELTANENNEYRTDLTEQEIEAMPEYEEPET